MEIEEIYLNFTNKMAHLELFLRAINKTTEKEYKELSKHLEFQKNVDQDKYPFRTDFMNFEHIDGNRIKYSTIKSSLEEARKKLFVHKNKQYQWLLVEAYENFEDFLKYSYAYSGYKDNNSWPLKDYGNITFNQLANKDFEWFYSRAKYKEKFPKSVLNQFRELFPILKEYESQNSYEMNLRLILLTIESFRHVIVHNNGVVKDKDKFIQKTLKKSGLNDEKNIDRFKELMDIYIDNKGNILIYERYIKDSYGSHFPSFNYLTKFLLSYATLIKNSLDHH